MKFNENIKNREKKIIKNKRIENKFKQILVIFLIIMIYNVVLIFLSSVNETEFPLLIKAYIITTDSMQPELYKNDVVIVRKIAKDKLKIGDIITYRHNDEIITHRIEDIENNDIYFTKGDNNSKADDYQIIYDDILGKKVIKIPFIGKLINLLKNVLIIFLIVLMFFIILLFKIEQDEKSQRRRLKKKNEDKKWKNNFFD